MKVNLIVAGCGADRLGIGHEGGLPWRLPKEIKQFAKLTSHVPEGQARIPAVVMGRKTWQSIPSKFRPLKNR